MIDLSDKVALVTGGARGIGRAIVLRLATQGADVAFSYRGNAAAAADTASAVEALGRRALAVQADVKDPAAAETLVKATLEAFGKVDILVNNAGITRDDLIMRLSEEAWRDVIDTNLGGAFFTCRAVARPMMKRRGGAIVNMSSIVGVRAVISAWSASGRSFVSSVRTKPGATALTVIERLPSSRAVAFVRPIRPAFADE